MKAGILLGVTPIDDNLGLGQVGVGSRTAVSNAI